MHASLILWDVIDTHLDEAAFLYGLRARSLDAGHYTLAEVERGPEARLLAQLEGLLVGGEPVAEQRLWPTLADPDASTNEVQVAALALVEGGSSHTCAKLLERLDGATPAQARSIIAAFALSEREGLLDWQHQQLACVGGAARAGLLRAIAARSYLDEDSLVALCREGQPAELLALVELSRYSVHHEALRVVSEAVRNDDPKLIRTAIETALVRGYRGIERWARYHALEAESGLGRRGLEWIGLLGTPTDVRTLVQLLGDEDLRAEALWALALTGRVAAVDVAMDLLEGQLGPRAAELVHLITKLPCERSELWRPPSGEPSEPLPPLARDDLDADLTLPEDAKLPIPDPQAVRSWWQAKRRTLDPDQRYLFGRPWNQGLVHALSEGPTRRRPALALALSIASRGRHVVHTNALCFRQRHELAEVERALAPPAIAEAS